MIISEMIHGYTVDLRSVFPDDAEVTYRMRIDSDKVKYMHKITGTIEDQRNFIIAQNEKEGDYLFLVLNKKGEPIGMRGIYNVDQDSAESGRTIGYGNAFENMEALLLGFEFAFDKLNVKKIYMDAAEDNMSIRGIQQKIGAVELKREYDEELGYTYVFSVLEKEDYLQKRKAIMKMIRSFQQKRINRGKNNE